MDFLRQAVDKLDKNDSSDRRDQHQQQQHGGYNQQQGYTNQPPQHGHYDGQTRYDAAPLRPDQQQQSGASGLVGSLLSFSDQRDRNERTGLQPVATQSTTSSGGGLLGTVKDMFDGGEERRRREEEERRRLEEEERRRREQGGLLGKLGGLASDLTGGGRKEEKASGSQGMHDKLYETFSGKKKQDEDFIDKGVDLVQEHILGQGSQKNESVVEQMKDAQIANMVRGALGRNK